MRLSGAEILLESLLQEKVEVLFGFPGGVVLDIYNMLFESQVRHILVRHEQGAVHAADGYARASGKPGVCLVTSGPGATNTVTGIATAYMDSVPVVVFTGQVPTAMIGNDAFQEADIVGITLPCTKYSYLVRDTKDLARIVKEAFYIATTGRPGPVVIDLPRDILSARVEFKYPEKVELRGYNPNYNGHQGQTFKLAKALAKAKRPVIYAGGGVIISEAAEELRELAELTHTPVTTTLMGLGGFPGNHPLFLGMLGMHGTYSANMAISEADLVVAVGARFDDRVTGRVDDFAVHAKIVHIDIDPTSISKNVSVHIPVVGDARRVLERLNSLLREEEKDWATDHRDWLEQIATWRESHPLSYSQEEEQIKPQYVVEKIYQVTQGEAIITTEVGQNQMWTAQYYKFLRPRTLLSSGGLGTMGYGFPAAIGAQVAFPHRTVIDIAGDGSFQMNIQELATAVEYRLPVKVAILNNHFLGMVRQWQQLFYNKRYSYTGLGSIPDFVKIAEAYGAVGLRATRPQEVEAVIREALSIPGPVVMDFEVAPEECVYPMVPAGSSLRNMLLA
ncbi:MAG: biosynthetic-type acetolactate synthase large subunit [Candidatus Tectomicrobia bacterium]|uniref:Acetolactate synthase n=1 Tax=Tectimicrobiota bacterium TaxID=2528274 RepID=A0A932FVU1_UNCTE|nr:biosynthetic-type acetolactate synthase large subunit [Candidatus Tectomicrobia bacterium]